MMCQSNKQLDVNIGFVLEGGGEGVILRKPGSLYENGRSSSLIKLKVTKKKKTSHT
jgi:ATP-dependent DNA ligase